MMSEYNKKLICYRCGSDDTEFLKENSNNIVYKCKNCNKIIIKTKRGKERWINYKH